MAATSASGPTLSSREQPIWRTQPIIAGALAGIAGGIAFGLMMQLMMPQMIGMIGSLVGVPALGWVVHLVISAIIGAGFGLALANFVTGWGSALGLGLAYGFVWWILGPLLIMPIMMGLGPQFGSAFEQGNIMSLVGHLVFGAVTGTAFKAIARS
jgi:hypothetical protein